MYHIIQINEQNIQHKTRRFTSNVNDFFRNKEWVGVPENHTNSGGRSSSVLETRTVEVFDVI